MQLEKGLDLVPPAKPIAGTGVWSQEVVGYQPVQSFCGRGWGNTPQAADFPIGKEPVTIPIMPGRHLRQKSAAKLLMHERFQSKTVYSFGCPCQYSH